MTSTLCLMFIPLIALAQEQAPPEVDHELRARVSAFYQNFVDGSPRKAEPFVAEDTKDFYYNAGKAKYESFKIGKVTYSDNFTKATVTVIGKSEKLIGGQAIMMDAPADTHWKLENGKWCWTYNPADYSITPFGGSNPPAGTSEDREIAKRLKNSSPEAVRSAGMAVLEQQPMRTDKTMVTISAGQAASDRVVFTNGADGEIQIALDGPVVRGLTAKLDKTTVPGGGTAILTLAYDPSDKSGPKDVWEPKGLVPFRIIATPFNRVFPVYIQFVAAK